MDTESIIKGLVTEYLKPKYPIYRVWYIETSILNDDTLRSEQFCALFEVTPIDVGDSNELMDTMYNYPKTMSEILRRNFDKYGVTVHKYCQSEHCTIYKMERVA